MIHLVTWLPHPYQTTVCRVLFRETHGQFKVWFGEKAHPDYPYRVLERFDCPFAFLDEEGYAPFMRALRNDPEPVVILGGWRTPMSSRVFAITRLLRVPLFIWADHPHPRERGVAGDFLRRVFIRTIGRTTAGILATGNPTREHFISLGVPARKVHNFPIWTDVPQTWSPPPAATEAGRAEPLRAIAIGRHVDVKRFDTAVRAVAHAAALGSTVQLTLAGAGPDTPRLQELARSLGCAELVHFPGWLDAAEVASAIEETDVLIIPSAFEPFGIVVLEAMAAARPVLASDKVVAAHDRADDSRAIQFHHVGDAATLAEQLVQFDRDRELLLQAAQASRAIAAAWPPERAATILQECVANIAFAQPIIAA